MAHARELTLQLPHLTLAAKAWGEPGATPVLALHGWLDNAASFDALAPLLPNVHLVALDLPGHGRSSHRPPGAWYHYIDYLGDVLAAADALGFERFTLLGHSLGGAVASVLAGAAPERVAGAWLIEALGPMATPPEKALALLRQALAERGALAQKALRRFRAIDDAINARMAANDLTERAARTLVERGVRRHEDGSCEWSTDPRLTMTSAIRLTEEQILAYLAGIACPTLLVLADPPPAYFPTETVERRVRAVADIDVVRIAGHHHLHLEDPQPVARAINGFRAKVASRAA